MTGIVSISILVMIVSCGHSLQLHRSHASVSLSALFLTFLPIPVVLLTDKDGSQNVHIAPEAFAVSSVEFADEIQVWQDALPGSLKGQLSSVSTFQ